MMAGSAMTAIPAAAVLYFAIVFAAGFALGPIRVLAVEPRLGPFTATLCEAPFLLAAMYLGASHVPVWLKMTPQTIAMLSMGGGALVLGLSADLLVGTLLRGMSWRDQATYFATPSGQLYAALLVAFGLMPFLVSRV